MRASVQSVMKTLWSCSRLAHGVAQQRRVVARQRRHDQHGRLRPSCASSAVGSSVKRLKRSRRQNGLLERHLLLHRDVDAVDAGRGDVELAASRIPWPAGASGRARPTRAAPSACARTATAGGCTAWPTRWRTRRTGHQRALGFVELIQHRWLLGDGAPAASLCVAAIQRSCTHRACAVRAHRQRENTWYRRHRAPVAVAATLLTCTLAMRRDDGVDVACCSARPRRCGPNRRRRCRTRCAGAASAPSVRPGVAEHALLARDEARSPASTPAACSLPTSARAHLP